MKAKFIFILCLLCTSSVINLLWAVPACPDWLVMSQPDQTTIELRLMGDEFYHFWVNRDGQEMVQDADGWWIETEQQLTINQRKERRASAARDRDVDELQQAPVDPLPTKMLVILVSFSDTAMLDIHDNNFFDDMLNKKDNPPYGSVRDYFIATSDGKYSPNFDVFGPVVLDNTMAYYGGNDASGNDLRPRQMVYEACQKADAMGCNFANYDGDGDGVVDNVYVIYAGYAESSGGGENTIWPHSWTLSGISGKIDGKSFYRYGCSAELDGTPKTNINNDADGIGTFAHEFSHVIGMPDYYDTKYGYNYDNNMTPGKWSLMDHGSYNGNGQRPPLYSIFDKCYMGWASMPPVLAKNDHLTVTMSVGTAYSRHISGTSKAVPYTTTDTVYYLENRQQEGNFDGALPGEGLVIWRVIYQSSWSTPNNDANAPRYSLVSATGLRTNIGTGKDPFPGSLKKTSVTLWPGCELTEISNSNDGVVSFKYNGGELVQYQHTWIANGTPFTTTTSYSTLTLPVTTPEACSATRQFHGWTTQQTMQKDGSDLTLVKAGEMVKNDMTYYAVYRTTTTPTRYFFSCDDAVHATLYDYFEMAPGQTYTWNGQTYHAAGLYISDTIRTIHGDSLLGLQLNYVDPAKAIIYKAPDQLDEVTRPLYAGLHTNAFDQKITQHYFSNGIGLISFGDTLRTVGRNAFYGCRSLLFNKVETITLAPTVTTIAPRAFHGCYEATEIDMGTSLLTIGDSAFQNCASLKDVTIPEGVTYIGKKAFFSCDNLRTLDLPESLIRMDKHTLQDCSKLSTITSRALTPPGTYSSTFSGITRSKVKVNVFPTGVGDYKKADQWRDFFIQQIICDHPTTLNIIKDTICQGQTYTYKGMQFQAAATYIDTTWNKYGCDTVISQLELSVMPTYAYSSSAMTCSNQPYIWHNMSLTQTGIYYDSLTTIYGCDSVYTLDLWVSSPAAVDTMQDAICDGDTYAWRGMQFTESGVYSDTLTSQYGCDSAIHCLQLTINPALLIDDSMDVDTIFVGDSIEWRGRIYQQTGMYADTTYREFGCDTVVYRLDLTVMPNTPTRMDNCATPNKRPNSPQKYIQRGRLYIERNGIKYDAMGKRLNP